MGWLVTAYVEVPDCFWHVAEVLGVIDPDFAVPNSGRSISSLPVMGYEVLYLFSAGEVIRCYSRKCLPKLASMASTELTSYIIGIVRNILQISHLYSF